MDKIKVLKNMIEIEKSRPEKDDAGIYIPGGVDAAVRCKLLMEILDSFGKD